MNELNLENKELYKEHKRLVHEQGRKPAWIARQLDCSYSLVYQYLNGLKPMSKKRVVLLHKILISNEK